MRNTINSRRARTAHSAPSIQGNLSGTGKLDAMARSLAAIARGRVTARHLQVALGVIWLLDGALQLQPFMFTKGFLTQILEPTAAGQPAPIAHSILGMAHFLQPNLIAWNALFAGVQLAIGAGLLFTKTAKPALLGSFVWSFLVWWLAEGFGGLLTGSASALTGAPGAVLLYVVVGLCAWPASSSATADSVSASPANSPAGILGSRGARAVWGALWLGFAALSVMPANIKPGALSGVLASSASGEPGVLVGLDRLLARLIRGNGTSVSIALAVVETAIGVAVLLRWHPKAFLGLGVALAMAFWVAGQDLGGILSGQGTDPNAGPLVALLAVALWGVVSQSSAALVAERRSRRHNAQEHVVTTDGGIAFDA